MAARHAAVREFLPVHPIVFDEVIHYVDADEVVEGRYEQLLQVLFIVRHWDASQTLLQCRPYVRVTA